MLLRVSNLGTTIKITNYANSSDAKKVLIRFYIILHKKNDMSYFHEKKELTKQIPAAIIDCFNRERRN